MSRFLNTAADWLWKAGILILAMNEIRGLILAGPILYTMYEMGGTAMAIWLGFCSLTGLILSVAVPLMLKNKLKGLIVRAKAIT